MCMLMLGIEFACVQLLDRSTLSIKTLPNHDHLQTHKHFRYQGGVMS